MNASNPGTTPPNQELNMMAQSNSDTGADSKCSNGQWETSAAAATERTAAPYAQIAVGFLHKRESEPNILLLREHESAGCYHIILAANGPFRRAAQPAATKECEPLVSGICLLPSCRQLRNTRKCFVFSSGQAQRSSCNVLL